MNPDTRQIVQPGEHGELCVKSPMIMSGYWKNPAVTRQSFDNAWFKTGNYVVRSELYQKPVSQDLIAVSTATLYRVVTDSWSLCSVLIILNNSLIVV